MNEDDIIFETTVPAFYKRIIMSSYISVLVFAVFLLTAILNIKKDNVGFMIMVLTIGTIMLSVEYYYSYKKAYNKIKRITFTNGWFVFEVLRGNKIKTLVIAEKSIGTILQFEGNQSNTAHLTILNGTEKVIELYAAISQFRPQRLDEIAYKINKQISAKADS